MAKISSPEFRNDTETRQALRARLPAFRLSKFQGALPDTMQVEMVGAYLLDFDGARAFLGPSHGSRDGVYT